VTKVTIDEVKDVLPIFRANPFLIEEGARFVAGEKFLTDKSLERIDISLMDRNGISLFVEVEWSRCDRGQAERYLYTLRNAHKGPFRLMFLVPDDIIANLPSEVEIKRYSREKIMEMVRIRNEAREALLKILDLLNGPVTPSPSLMLRQSVTFPNIISACYFDAKVKTERGYRKIGLRKQSIGRYLDTIRCIAQSLSASDLPELTVLLLDELMNAPYYYEYKGQGFVDPYGFYHHVIKRKDHNMYRQIADITVAVKDVLNMFINRNVDQIREFYGDSPRRIDLLYRCLLEIPKNSYEFEQLQVRTLINHMIRSFNLYPTQPLTSFKHTILNTEVINNVNVKGYENDFAKRLVELAVLKGALIPVSGVPAIRVLKREVIFDKQTFQRVGCQSFRLNTEENFISSYIGLAK
jgi:hypothetical protein